MMEARGRTRISTRLAPVILRDDRMCERETRVAFEEMRNPVEISMGASIMYENCPSHRRESVFTLRRSR